MLLEGEEVVVDVEGNRVGTVGAYNDVGLRFHLGESVADSNA